jgi:TusA-related sulfurtransferase
MPLYEIAMFIDARGLTASVSIAKTDRGIRSIQPGEIVEVYATDVGTVGAFHAWARHTGHELLDWTSDRGTYRFVIRHQ